jgi:hypothetical protein
MLRSPYDSPKAWKDRLRLKPDPQSGGGARFRWFGLKPIFGYYPKSKLRISTRHDYKKFWDNGL